MKPFSPKDPNKLTVEEAVSYAHSRITFSLNKYLSSYFTDVGVYRLAIGIAQEALRLEKKQKKSKSSKPYKIRPTASFLVNQYVFNELGPYKEKLKKRILMGELRLDEETTNILNIWFLEHLFNIALFHNWYWAAVAVLKILFIYNHEEFKELTIRLDYADGRYPDDPKFREWKDRMIDDLESWFEGLIIKEEVKVGSKIEHHFKRPPNPAQNLDSVKVALRAIRPVKPECTLHNKFSVESLNGPERLERLKKLLEELERLKELRAKKDFNDNTERKIMQLLSCPDCLINIFEALQSYSEGKLFSNWPEKLGLPIYAVPTHVGGQGRSPMGAGSGGMTPFQHRPFSTSGENKKTDLNKELRRRDDRRRKLSHEHVLIVVDNGAPIELRLDRPAARRITLSRLTLRDGDSIIEVRGSDDEGELPIDMHYVGWEPEIDDSKPYVFVTKLRGGRRLSFTLNYHRDKKTGDLTSATVDIEYSRTKYIPESFPVWAPQAIYAMQWAAIAATVAVVCISTYLVVQSLKSEDVSPSQLAFITNAVERAVIVPKPQTSTEMTEATPPTHASVTNEDEDKNKVRMNKPELARKRGVSPRTFRNAPAVPPDVARAAGGNETVDEHEIIEVSFNNAISSYTAQRGQVVYTTVTRSVKANGIFIPEGFIIKGTVLKVTKASDNGGVGTLSIQFRASFGHFRAKREMVFVGDKKTGYRLVASDELSALRNPSKGQAPSPVHPYVRPKNVEALVPAGKKFHLSLEKVSLPARAAQGSAQ